MHALLVSRAGAAPTRRDLAGPVVAGGSQADGLHLPGWPAAALRLQPCAAGIVVEAVAGGARAAGHPLHPGTRRLLRPGESAELHGVTLEVAAPPRREETRAAAAALLRDAAAGAAPPSGLHLVFLTGAAAGARRALAPEQTVGRGRAATIVLPDATASRVHARLTLGTDGLRVQDLGSKNGVRVNGVRIERQPFPLRVGDELTVGETSLAVADGAPEPEPPAPAAGRRGPSARAVAAALLALSAAALVVAAG